VLNKSTVKAIVMALSIGQNVFAKGGAASADNAAPNAADVEFAALRDVYLEKFKPLVIASEMAWWDANTTGSDEAFARRKQAQNALVELHADRARFSQLKAIKEGGKISGPRSKRELDVMFRAHLPGQSDPELLKQIIALETEVEQTFNAHRGEVDGKPLSENDIRQILSE